MKPKVYLETSIISYFTARPSRDLVVAARQELTYEVWPLLKEKYDLYISALVIQEVSRGDEAAARKRLKAISGIPVLEITEDVQCLAKSLISENAIPPEYVEDALHIAVASLNGIEFLLTWSFTHINNAFKRSHIIRAIEKQGFLTSEICSPEEFLGV
ncbi:MAG: type II toxin-antitoxin system VapC family toxin [Candidatus Sabulitectum sp.]|nr:type II toxin-antitoxin system VapC family toxin [Candidatus Sabulitectum sp.]